jgi:hypothetical protein
VFTLDATVATAEDARAEGWRYLSRLARMGLEMMVEFADADFPVFYAASHDTVKIFAPNPDNNYLNATISGKREYRIHGKRGSVPNYRNAGIISTPRDTHRARCCCAG